MYLFYVQTVHRIVCLLVLPLLYPVYAPINVKPLGGGGGRPGIGGVFELS